MLHYLSHKTGIQHIYEIEHTKGGKVCGGR